MSDTNLKGRVLVADDDPAILRLVTTILEKEGFTVVGTRDGKEAYKALQEHSDITAAVFDVVMPHISGPELVRYMRTEKRFNNIPVMMMTAEQDPKLSRDSFAAGAVVFLPKPFTTAQLQTMLRMLIGRAKG
ncbi:MAG TPA: response regulator [Pyrinomonadaceae bacterium]|nr:response regulator [Pyrinomonadaceae bacterium]